MPHLIILFKQMGTVPPPQPTRTHMPKRTYVYTEQDFATYGAPPKSYGCLSFMGDAFMTLITGGLWLIWVFVREMRKR